MPLLYFSVFPYRLPAFLPPTNLLRMVGLDRMDDGGEGKKERRDRKTGNVRLGQKVRREKPSTHKCAFFAYHACLLYTLSSLSVPQAPISLSLIWTWRDGRKTKQLDMGGRQGQGSPLSALLYPPQCLILSCHRLISLSHQACGIFCLSSPATRLLPAALCTHLPGVL